MIYNWVFKKDQFGKTSPTYVAYCRAFSLLDKIRELRPEKKTSLEGPENLLNIIETLAEGCIRRVNRLNDQLLVIPKIAPQQAKDIENTIRLKVFLLNKLHAFLRYVDATRLSRNPTGMIKPWELLIKKYTSKKFLRDLNVIIRPQWKYNYSYYNIITILKRIEGIIGDQETKLKIEKIAPSCFPILSFAGLERDNVLQHIVLAHEIGHLIDEIEEITDNEKVDEDISDTFKRKEILNKFREYLELSIKIMNEVDKLDNKERDASDDLFRQHKAISQAQNEISSKISKWLEEITADIIAVRIIGPSFIFALYQTQIAQVSKMGPVGDYPPPQIRVENCIKYWKEVVDKDYKFFDENETGDTNHIKIKICIKDYLDKIEKRETELSVEPSPIDELEKQKHNLLTEILQQVVEKPLNSIKDLLEQKVPPFRLGSNLFNLIEELKNRITPVALEKERENNGYSKCDIATILNAGWIFWLTHQLNVVDSEKQKGEGESTSLEKLRRLCYQPLVEISNLILKGIELTDFSAQFSDFKDKLESQKKK